ncbi:unnamed protein product [Nippostrongylus brasiliensis]|uniref:Rac GTPase-activating protein 1 (inferred by orthology to a human protein) n=1 Tax=Nippostrongylus brasiliensis TaxID=27835 RepID=A0A0N4YGA3_NIPBR|nr:unnamed protein product [Nippostrongylus brasiliensis]
MEDSTNQLAYSSEESRKIMQLYGALHSDKEGYLTVSLQEMLCIVDQCERLRLNWKAAEEKAKYEEEQHTKASSELESVKTQLLKCSAELKDARAQIRAQLAEAHALRADADEMIERFKLVKELLKTDLENLPPETRKQLAFLRNPDLGRTNSKRVAREQYMEGDTEETMDYDLSSNTLDTLDEIEDDELNRRVRNRSVGLRGRRSVSAHAHPTSKRRSSRLYDAAAGPAAINENDETRDSPLPAKRSRETAEEITTTTTVTIDPSRKKPSQAKVTIRRSMNRSMSANDLLAAQAQAKTPSSGFVPRTTSTLELRTPKRNAVSWTRGMPIATRPHHFQPLSTYFKEFCPATPPMIAFPIIYCVVDLENRGLSREGLYRVPGRKDHVQSVLNELRTSRGIPKLCIQETEVVVDVIKSFLKDLRDPLVPKSSREEFIRAAQTNNILALNVAVCDLPQPNRDTLSYLMLHLQRVEALKNVNKMSAENIARCLAMSIMGQTVYPRGEIHVASNDAREKERSVLQMLKMSSGDVGSSGQNRTPATAPPYEEIRAQASAPPYTPSPCPDQSMLGPLTRSTAHNVVRPVPRRPAKFFDNPT